MLRRLIRRKFTEEGTLRRRKGLQSKWKEWLLVGNDGRMQNKYQNKFRVASTRLTNWDYSWNGDYFVTICTYRRNKYFASHIIPNIASQDASIINQQPTTKLCADL